MKILFLNRHLQNSTLVPELQRLGVACLVCSDPSEADLVLRIHGRTINLISAHDEEGVQFLSKVKKDEKFSQIASIITTSVWTESQCAEHQKKPEGANAYLKTPHDDNVFIKTIDLIFGTELSHGKPLSRPSAEDLSRLQDYAATQMIQKESLESVSLSIESSASSVSVEAAQSASQQEGISLDVSLDQSPVAIESSQGQSIAATDSSASTAAEKIDLNIGSNVPEIPAIIAEAVSSDGIPAVDSGEFSIDLSPPPEDLIPADKPQEIKNENVSVSEASNPSLMIAGAQSHDDFAHTTITQVVDSLTVDASITNPGVAVPAQATLKSMQVAEESDDTDLPKYLATNRRLSDVLTYPQPVGDAVVPGGASQTPDEETLKKYLLLREQDVAILSAQFKQSKSRINELEKELNELKGINAELMHISQEQEKRIKNFEIEKQVYEKSSQQEVDDAKFELKKRNDKVKVLEIEVRKMVDETEKLKERVKMDIRKIRTREKELENRLEILKKDSEALLASREQKIVDLKRKLDTTEFNLDLLQDKYEQEKKNSAQLREKLDRAAQAVRVAGGLLHTMESSVTSGESPLESKESDTVKHAV